MVYFFDNYESLPLEKYRELLPADRAEKLERLRQKRDRENCLAAYLLLKYALNGYGVTDFQLDTDENGKPFLKDCGLFFNLSHCRLGVAAAVSESAVGIDIQDIVSEKDGVIRRICTDGEIKSIDEAEDRDREFTRLWTLKEAAAKCDGRGMKIISGFSFENCGKSFEKYGRKFTTFERKNLMISVCGNEDFSDIKEIKNLEVF